MIQQLFSTSAGRLGLVVLFFLTVNLGSGLLAVEFRYPSLWGNREVFHEYAYPAPYNWAIVHILSMVPLAYLVYQLPDLTPNRVRFWQVLSLVALVILFFIEVKLPYGRLRNIPFALFFIVDVVTLIVITCLFNPPWKTLIGLAVIVGLVSGYQIVTSIDFATISVGSKSEQSAPVGFFSEVDEVSRPDYTEYVAVVTEIVGPNMGPDRGEICDQAEQLIQRGSPDILILMVHPWFEPEKKYVYFAGESKYDAAGNWVCGYQLPQPKEEQTGE